MISVFGFREAWPLIKDLVEDQWKEVDHRSKYMDLSIIEKYYESLEDSGVHFVVIAEKDNYNGDVVGFASMLISPNPHTGVNHLLTDSVYVRPEYRKLGYGVEMIKAAEEEGIDRGANNFSITFKSKDDVSSLTEGLGFSLEEVVYSKPLIKEGDR